ncbi:cytochrome P450 89A2 [Vitis vinifera]|uniref:Cytochrome P450 89A2 n=1 Tax=Vitis vinifera TaxID=29760 RepID=F6HEA0_VITVI|nr:cytochrome P450 89A2 [Vitis vinifera]|eukprot:XP_019081367.1 PREDICTED: cytochrome P450 89A2-like [Vitis vinifera]
MEIWVFLFVVSLCIASLLKSLHDFFFPKLNLPPGPAAFPLIGNLHWLGPSFADLEPILRNLHAKYGPILTLRIGSRPAIFISENSLAHQALVQNGAVFADRPAALPASRVMSSNQRNINSSPYGPTWRLLRRNLTAEILHSSRVRSYSHARKWVLEILVSRLRGHSDGFVPVRIMDHFQYAMFCLLVLMCFGDKLEEKQIQEIEMIQRKLLLAFRGLNRLNLWPRMGKILFRKRWEEWLNLRKDQEAILLPHIRARQRLKQETQNKQEDDSSSSSKDYVLSYVDTLLDLQLPEEKRKLNEGEMVTLCSEFLSAGTDTTSTALQWIMANLVKAPHIQARLFEEISGVVGEGEEEVKEEDLQKMPYLKAVVLEGLRRHPPGHFVLPHSVTQDVSFEGYDIPKNATVNFSVSDMNWNPTIWEDPMEFKPERFLNSNGDGDHADAGKEFDITGSKEIKMMPFGAGRRICPGYGLAMLHLEYFVGNLVWNFEWKAVEGDEVDLSEKLEFTVVMKNPLQAHLSPRLK